ncbi:hypothetical protein HOV42_gp34 [Gordonia phage Fairfaxidum]|uniref:Uncharacterized protein n=1 Tax=Gordonia phage Fairfaxidum TaxID=2572526 RepID=A0A4D6TA79_9CAUD|nr:hypothetical protein HOV42_gp34 [Gordonia phage Fairfaxidum]QCG77617.1 hypothetical protein SEA_FAIRFAXIDUM_34 [Gordonia phage Fairfaxidum]
MSEAVGSTSDTSPGIAIWGQGARLQKPIPAVAEAQTAGMGDADS